MSDDTVKNIIAEFEHEFSYLIAHKGESRNKLSEWLSTEEISALRLYEALCSALSRLESGDSHDKIVNDLMGMNAANKRIIDQLEKELADYREAFGEDGDSLESGEGREAVLAKIDKAWDEVSELCKGKRWTMHIPAQPDSDSDLVISDALYAARQALAAPVLQGEDRSLIEELASTKAELAGIKALYDEACTIIGEAKIANVQRKIAPQGERSCETCARANAANIPASVVCEDCSLNRLNEDRWLPRRKNVDKQPRQSEGKEGKA